MFALRVIVLVVSLFASLAAGPTFALADTGSTPSPTPTDTTAPVTSPSDTPSPSPTDSPSPAPSPTGNPSPSPSPTDSPSPEPSPTPTDAASASPSPSPTPTATGPTAGLIVQMFSGLTSDQEQAVIANDGGTETGSVPALRMFFIDVPASDVSSYVQAYESDPNVVSVDRDRNRDTQGAPSDPAYPDQWALPQIGWDQAYGSVNLSGSATIAVLDTGVDGSTSDLSGSLVPGWSAFGADPTSDPNGHGTWLASIAAAATNNGDGIAGVDYAGANIMPVQVLDANGTGQDSDIINGLVWAVSNGANVILMGFSNPGYSQALQDAVSYAWSHGVVLVAATGNDGVSTPNYPAGDAHVVGVAATDFGDPLWGGSNYGVDTLIAAPGVGITADAVGGGTVSVTGTSTSAAIVAGAAAALIEEDPSAGPGVIVGRLARNADPAGTQDQTGNGRLNLDRSLQDSSSDPVDPAGAPGGGPFVGPYVAAARNLNVFFAGSGGGSVTVSVPGSDTISYPTTGSGACTGATGNGTSSVTIVASCNLNTTGTPNASITATPNGTSSFTSWASSPSLGTCTGSNSATTCSTGTLPGGQNAVTVTFTGLRTSSTALLCSPASVPVNAPTSCTATVADTSSGTPTTPTGSVSFSGGTGSFSPASCTLSSGSCSVNFTPAAGSEGSQSLTATYGGDSLHSGSAGSFSITATKRSSTTTVNCSPASVAINVSTTCTATVADNSAGTAIRPGGTVSFSGGTGSFSPTSCTLPAPGRTPAR